MNINFETNRLKINAIRSFGHTEVKDVLSILTDDVTQFLPPAWQHITTQDEATQWLSNQLSEGVVLGLQDKQSASVIGYLFLSGFDESRLNRHLRIGYVLSKKYWGVGIASEMIASLIPFLAEEGSVASITGGVSMGNTGSVKVLTKNGFSFIESMNGAHFYQYTF